MPGPSDSLDLSSIRLRKEYPIAEVQHDRAQPAPVQPEPLRNPQAAAEARAKIAGLADVHPLSPGMALPHAPTGSLILDRATLAAGAAKAPVVARRGVPSALIPLLTAAGIFLLVLLLFKAPVIISQFQYSLQNKTPAAAVVTSASEIIPAENSITIPKINVHAPVIYEPSIQEAAIQKALQNGVVHYGNTATPGQNGNVAIFGHSSNDWWEPGNYKFVFVLLDKLAPGDQITVDYNSKRYTFEVTGSRVVEPTEVSVLNPTKDPTLTLITCTPPGTSLKRLVVTAKQIGPTQANTEVATAPASTGASTSAETLPSAAPSFMDQLSAGWKGMMSGLGSLFGGGGGKTTTEGQIPAAK